MYGEKESLLERQGEYWTVECSGSCSSLFGQDGNHDKARAIRAKCMLYCGILAQNLDGIFYSKDIHWWGYDLLCTRSIMSIVAKFRE